MNQGNIVLSLIFYFKKAFDCVDHVIVPGKLLNYEVRGVAYHWFSL